GKLDGSVDTLSLPASGRAVLLDLDGDGKEEVLRTTMSTLTVAAAGEERFRASFPDAASARAFPVPMEDGSMAVGLVLPEQDQVRLYDASGALWPGFPMRGAVQFRVADINLDGTLEVVTADSEGVITVHVLPAGR